MRLYEIDIAIEQIVDQYTDPETGEFTAYEALEALMKERDEKVESVALWIKDLKAEIEALKAEKQAFEKRIKTSTNKMESLKNYLDYALAGSKFKTPRCQVSYRTSTSAVIDDGFLQWAEQGHDEYLRYKEPEVNKTALTDALKNGAEIPFARLETKQNIQIK